MTQQAVPVLPHPDPAAFEPNAPRYPPLNPSPPPAPRRAPNPNPQAAPMAIASTATMTIDFLTGTIYLVDPNTGLLVQCHLPRNFHHRLLRTCPCGCEPTQT